MIPFSSDQPPMYLKFESILRLASLSLQILGIAPYFRIILVLTFLIFGSRILLYISFMLPGGRFVVMDWCLKVRATTHRNVGLWTPGPHRPPHQPFSRGISAKARNDNSPALSVTTAICGLQLLQLRVVK